MVEGKRNKQAALVLNKVNLPNNDIPLGVDNVPIGLIEDKSSLLSANFGTDRDAVGGGCVVGNGNAYIQSDILPYQADSFIISFTADFKSNQHVAVDNILWLNESTTNRILVQSDYSNGGTNEVILYVNGELAKRSITLGVHEIIVTYSSGTSILYVDGVEAITIENQTLVFDNNMSLTVGATPDGNNPIVSSIWDIKLNANDTDLVFYKCDSQSETTLYDSSGNGNDATIQDYYEGFWGDTGGDWRDRVGFTDWHWDFENFSTVTETQLYSDTYNDLANGSQVGTRFFYRIECNPYGEGTHAIATSTTYIATIEVKNLATGSFQMRMGRDYLGVTITDPISSNGVHKIQITSTTNTAYGEYLYLGNNTSDAFVTLLDMEEVDKIGQYLPRDESNKSFDVRGNILQFKGLVPSQAKFVESNCFKGDSIAGIQANTDIINSTNWALSCRLNDFAELETGEINKLLGKSNNTSTYIDIIRSTNNGINLRNVAHNYIDCDLTLYNNFELCIIDSEGVVTVYVDGDLVGTGVSSGLMPLDMLFNRPFYNVDSGLLCKAHDFKTWELNNAQSYNYSDVQSLTPTYRYPLSEYITDPSNHTAHDVVGGNHATLVNGSEENRGLQDEFHYSQLGQNTYPYFQGESVISRLNVFNPSTRNWKFEFGFIWDDSQTDLKSFFGSQVTSPSTGLQFDYTSSSDMRVFAGLGGTYTTITTITSNVAGDVITGYIEQVDDLLSVRIFRNGVIINTTDRDVTGITMVFSHLSIGGVNVTYSKGVMLYARTYVDSTTLLDTQFYYYGDYSGWSGNILTAANPHQIPASATNPTLDALGNPLTLAQDGKSFLDTGTKLQHLPMPRVLQADTSNIWFEADGTPKNLDFEASRFGGWDNQYYSANQLGDTVTNITTHKEELIGRQDITEMRVRDTEETTDPVIEFENLYFDYSQSEDIKVVRGLDWYVTDIDHINNHSDVTTSSGSIYNVGDKIAAGDYLIVTPNADKTITILTIKMYMNNYNLYENIFFDSVGDDTAKIVRGFDFSIPVDGVVEFGGSSTIRTSSGSVYTLGNTVAAGDYLTVSNTTELARTIIKLNKL